MAVETTGRARAGLDYDDEYLFLNEREIALSAELDERSMLLEDEYPEGTERPRGLGEWPRLWRRELELVQDLKERIARVALDELLKRRLRQVHLCLARLTEQARDRGTYSAAYWREEEERQILNSLLRQWGVWRYGSDDEKDGP